MCFFSLVELNSPFVGQAVVLRPPLSPAWEGTVGGGACCAALQRPSPVWAVGSGCPCSVCSSCKSWLGFQELEAITTRVQEMEKEDERMKELQLEAERRFIVNLEGGMGCPWVLLSLQGQCWSTGW